MSVVQIFPFIAVNYWIVIQLKNLSPNSELHEPNALSQGKVFLLSATKMIVSPNKKYQGRGKIHSKTMNMRS